MGGGGGGAFGYRSPQRLRDLVWQEEERTSDAAFQTGLAGVFGELLAGYNARDTEAVGEHLKDLREILRDSLGGQFDQLFGGSVAKHTYVDGMSDIDSLVVINDSDLEGGTPMDVLNSMSRIISTAIGDTAVVSVGRMAVTIDYGDGLVIQVLPALRTSENDLRVPSSRRPNEWSRIDPISFQAALTRRNSECNGKLVPTIKLAKAIIGQLPEAQQLTGYHVESLAIAAFRDYRDNKTTVSMLPKLFEEARDRVLEPIRDSTGQSIHVDDYLGEASSQARTTMSHILGRLARRMRNASAASSIAQWRTLFGSNQ